MVGLVQIRRANVSMQPIHSPRALSPRSPNVPYSPTSPKSITDYGVWNPAPQVDQDEEDYDVLDDISRGMGFDSEIDLAVLLWVMISGSMVCTGGWCRSFPKWGMESI